MQLLYRLRAPGQPMGANGDENVTFTIMAEGSQQVDKGSFSCSLRNWSRSREQQVTTGANDKRYLMVANVLTNKPEDTCTAPFFLIELKSVVKRS